MEATDLAERIHHECLLLNGIGLDDLDSEARTTARAHAAESLGRLLAHRAEPQAEEALRTVLSDPEAPVRQRAVWALGRRTPPEPATITAMTALLHDPVDSVRAEASEALGRVGPSAVVAVPDLRRMAVSDPSSLVRRWAAWASARLTGVADETARTLVAILLNPSEEPEVRREAAEGLGHLGVEKSEVLDALRLTADSLDPVLAAYSREALHRLVGEQAMEGMPSVGDHAFPEPEAVLSPQA